MDLIFDLLLIVTFLILLISTMSMWFTFRPKVMTYQEAPKIEIEHGSFTQDYLDSLEMEETFIDSSFGYQLHVASIMVEKPIGTIIMAHGYTATLYSALKYDHLFRDMGFNVVLYDQPYHGLSGGDCCTFGAREKDDLKSVMDFAISKVGHDLPIGTFGESLGGATVLMHGAIDRRVDFIISDCAYADAATEFAERMKADYHIRPFPFVYVSSLLSKLMIGYFYKDMSPIKLAKSVKAPTLIIHGTEDSYTHIHHGHELFEALTCEKDSYFVKGADHAESYFKSPDEYREVVKTFLVKQGLNI